MTRQAVRWLVALFAVTLLLDTALGQNNPERITIRNKDGTTKGYDGELKFGPTGFQIVSADKKVLVNNVAPDDVVKIAPGDYAGVDRAVILGLNTAEEKKTKAEYEKARLGYTELLKKTLTAPEKTKRFVEYKLALMATRVADETSYEEKWTEIATEAANAWNSFIGNYKGSWEVWPAAKHGARIYAELNKFDEAARMWGRLAKADAGLPPDLRQEAAMQEIDCQIRSKAYANAQVAAEALGKAAGPGPVKDKLAMYELAAKALGGSDPVSAVKAIEAKLAATKDSGVRSVGYSLLGELYLAANRPRDAMWSYLWVETVFNTDRYEAFKAMCRLKEVFRVQGDEDRVRAYEDKLQRTRETL